jgi:autotransporter-associated beta strand protein
VTVNGFLNFASGGGTETIGSLAGSGTVSSVVSGSYRLVVGGSGSGTFSGVISNGSGVVGLTKSGNGTLTLSGPNSYTGGTIVSAGQLVGTTTSLQGAITNNASVAFDQATTGNYGSLMSGSGSLTKLGVGTVRITGSNSYSGGTTVTGGIVEVSAGGPVGGSAAGLGTGTVSIALGGQVTYYLSIAGTQTIANAFSLSGGTLYSEDGNNNFAGLVTLASGTSTISSRYQDTITLSGGLAGPGDVLLTQAGGLGDGPTYVLPSAGSNTGTIRVSGSSNGRTTKLQVANANALQSATLDMAAGDLGTVEFTVAGTNTYALGGLQGARSLAFGGNSLSVGGNNQSTTYTGTLSGSGLLTKVGNGTLTLSGSNSYTGGTTISSGTLQIGSGGTTGFIDGNVFNNATLAFNRSNALSFSGTISGTGGLSKQAAGLLTFAGVNSYSGLTTISAGTLALSGVGSIGTGGLNLGTSGSPGVFDLLGLTAGSYSLPSSASLTGVGTLSGNGKSLAVLGSLAPGNSAGTITVGTGLSLDLSQSGSSAFEITDPAYTAGTYDLVSGDGGLVFGGILNLAFSGGSYAIGTDVLQLFANTGGRSGNFSAVNFTGLAAGQSATFNPATGFITVVPEPSTCAMALAGLACGGYSMFRRRKRA